MPPKPLRKAVISAAALSVGLTGLLVGSSGAYASHPGTSGSLTATNGTDAVFISGGTTLHSPFDDSVSYGAWSADGSRLFYVDQDNNVSSLRYNDAADAFFVSDFVNDGNVKQNVTVDSSGEYAYWAEQNGGRWEIHYSFTDGGETGKVIGDASNDYTHPDAGPNGSLVFEKTASGGGTSEIWGYTSASDNTAELMVSDAASPAIAPDGQHLAFIRTTSGHAQVFVSDLSGGNVVQVTTDAVEHDNPTWSPDGATIAFNEGSAVKTAAANGSSGTPIATGLSGTPAYRPNAKDKVVRIYGAGRFATAIAVSQSHWATAGAGSDSRAQAQSVTLSRSDTYADALGGAALAAAKSGPLLMTPTAALDGPTGLEIQRVLGTTDPASKTVYLLGSTKALSQAVQDSVTAMGYNVVRVEGTSRFGTAVAIATEIDPTPDLILAATGMNFPDALGAGAAAGSYDRAGSHLSAVVVLTNNATLPAETKQFLDDNPSADVYGIGSQGLAATAAYNPIDVATAGGALPPSRYTTSVLTMEAFFGSTAPAAGLATGTNWPDALAGGALMATLNGPVLISAPTGLDPNMTFDLSWFSPSLGTIYTFGATSAVPQAVANAAGTWISGPAGAAYSENPTSAAAAHAPNGTQSLATSTTTEPWRAKVSNGAPARDSVQK